MLTALVTGSSRGLGLEFVKQYAADGWSVIATCRDPAKSPLLERVAAGATGRVAVEAMDVTDFGQVDRLAAKLKGTAIDVLVNNAGIARDDVERQRMGAMDYDGWLALLKTNTLAPIKVAEALMGNVAASGKKTIAAISSTVGSLVEMDYPVYPYATSKAALNKALRLMAAQFRDRGVIVLALCPGHAKTDMGNMAPGASVEVDASIAGMRKIIAGATMATSGSFTRWNGEKISW
ncbi:MAG: SDR family oxidoreductase [Alphaproteobacteria bacterium]|nr:SDR family oxidoreductase [Alphaproteobacteria bacterium]